MTGLIRRIEVEIDEPRLSQLPKPQLDVLTTGSNGIGEIVCGNLKTCVLGIVGAKDDPQNTEMLPQEYPDFRVKLRRDRQTLRLILENSPADAFPGGQITASKRLQVTAAIRDIVFQAANQDQAETPEQRTALVHEMLRDAGALNPTYYIVRNSRKQLERIVCWGGHSIGPVEYDFNVDVGKEFGLQHMEVITGGGPGIMRGSMKGNVKGLRQQNIDGRQIGITCPEIITVEPPNSWLNRLVIMPDMEKRLEAFARTANGIAIFPGGAGTGEEFLTALSIKLHPQNKNQNLPMALVGPRESAGYFAALDDFACTIFGKKIRNQYCTMLGDPEQTASWFKKQMTKVRGSRDKHNDDYLWNDSLHFPKELQVPFEPTYKNVGALQLHAEQEIYTLAAEIRKLFKTVVFSSVIQQGRECIKQNGKFQIGGDKRIVCAFDALLKRFIEEKRIHVDAYEPCYEFVDKTAA